MTLHTMHEENSTVNDELHYLQHGACYRAPLMPRAKGHLHPIADDLRDQLRRAFEASGRDMTEVAKKVGRQRTTVDRILYGDIGSSGSVPALARELGVEWDSARPAGATTTIALLGDVGAGGMYYASAETGPWTAVAYIEVPAGFAGFGAVRVVGKSMAPRYNHGDVILFRRVTDGWDPDACNGEECVVQLAKGGNAYVKILQRKGSKWSLLNLDHELFQSDVEIEWAVPVYARINRKQWRQV